MIKDVLINIKGFKVLTLKAIRLNLPPSVGWEFVTGNAFFLMKKVS